jgi:Flp pilus assembly protein TadG
MRAEVSGQVARIASSFELRATSRPDQVQARSAKRAPRGLSPLPFDLCPLTSTRGSALLEFAISLPLLVVFLVGIYDFSGAFNQKQKIEHAAQEGAIVAGAQPTSDIQPTNPNPDSLQPVVAAIFNSLAGSRVLPLAKQGDCNAPVDGNLVSGVKWSYTITGCPDTLTITIDRGWVPGNATAGALTSVGTSVTVSYPYRWRFNSVIQLLVPGARYAASTDLSETATVHNQM